MLCSAEGVQQAVRLALVQFVGRWLSDCVPVRFAPFHALAVGWLAARLAWPLPIKKALQIARAFKELSYCKTRLITV